MHGKLIQGFAGALITQSCLYGQIEYRSIDGSGNNTTNSDFGAAETPFIRKGPSAYGDGAPNDYDTPSGGSRPNPRDVSNAVSSQSGPVFNSKDYSNFVWLWGQFIDHDLALSETSSDPFNIPVALPDPLAPEIPLNRTAFDPSTGGLNGIPRQQVNSITAFLDASMVYGSDASRASALRASGGRLATSSPGMMPFNTGGLPNANDAGILPDDELFLGGDVRANENVGLTAMHTVFVREHNRIANSLAGFGFTDEEIYQKARSRVSGQIQSITYNEFLPALMGSSAPSLINRTYDSAVDPGITNEFATALYRLGHSMVSGDMPKINNSGATELSLSLDAAFFTSPTFLQTAEDVDKFLKGFAAMKQQNLDTMVIDDLRERLFGAPGSGGLDLIALNLQRGRDHGLPDYNSVRLAYGLSAVSAFDQITSDAVLAEALKMIYGDDISLVDPWIGAMAEDHLAGKGVGPLVEAALFDQFDRLLEGDRFFFLWDENLTVDERSEIMDRTLFDVLMDNTSITSLPGNVFFVPEPSALLASLLMGALLCSRRQRKTGAINQAFAA